MPEVPGGLTDEILQGGTVGVIAVLLAAVLTLGYAAIRIIRAFLNRDIITAATYKETRERDAAELARVTAERDRALELNEAQTDAISALAGTLHDGLAGVAAAIGELRAATEARNELEGLYHSAEQPAPARRRRARGAAGG